MIVEKYDFSEGQMKYLKEIEMQLKAIYSDIEFIDIMEAVCSDARNYVSDNPRASLEQFKEHIQINDVLCDWIENAPVDHVISKIDTKVVNKKYLKNMKYQLSLVYSKEDVRAIMDIIQEHVNIFLEQNPSASEEIIKQCICEIGNFVQVGIEDIDFHTLKIEELIGQKKKSIYYSYLPSLWNKCSKINPRPNFQIYAAG